MNSETTQSFWDAYRDLDQAIKDRARKAYKLWDENPFHPSLHFKCINQKENIWSVRITIAYRAVGVLDNDTVTWFWIGDHDAYEKYFG
jgi:hypothetical protein